MAALCCAALYSALCCQVVLPPGLAGRQVSLSLITDKEELGDVEICHAELQVSRL